MYDCENEKNKEENPTKINFGDVVVYAKEGGGLLNFALGDKFVVAGVLRNQHNTADIIKLYDNQFGANNFYYISRDLLDTEFLVTSERIADDILDSMYAALGIRKPHLVGTRFTSVHIDENAFKEEDARQFAKKLNEFYGWIAKCNTKFKRNKNEFGEIDFDSHTFFGC